MKYPQPAAAFASVALCLVLSNSPAIGEVVNINLTSGNGSNPNQTMDGTAFTIGAAPLTYSGTGWNDLGGLASAGLSDSDGVATGIGLSVDAGGNGNAGFTFSQADGLVGGAADILDNYLAANNGFGPALAGPLIISFTGLDDTSSYDFSFVSVGDTVGQGGSFTIGGTTLTTTGASPTGPLVAGDNFVSFTGVSSSGGNLDVAFTTGPDNTSFAALNAIQINVTAVPEPSSFAALLAVSGGLLSVRRRRVSKTAS